MDAATHVEPLAMRSAMGRFATGVAVITTQAPDGAAHGMTVNSLTSVSLEPPLLLVCFNRGARTGEAIVESGRFAVNILCRRQQPIAMRFARRGEDHFKGLDLAYGEQGVPVVPGALAQLECAVDRVVEAGDHTVVFGAPLSIRERDGEALGYFSGRFSDIEPHGHERPGWSF
ncbi:flavin reductase family protein [Jiangella muralis]|uniref:flavin reductase family protein n=1 Tax=Jiangella muralis TaxID=702383 RepID=UPI00069E2A40|nr:flavin reductase family protein [Jiangella muralis]